MVTGLAGSALYPYYHARCKHLRVAVLHDPATTIFCSRKISVAGSDTDSLGKKNT
jgi:hypothetical protein